MARDAQVYCVDVVGPCAKKRDLPGHRALAIGGAAVCACVTSVASQAEAAEQAHLLRHHQCALHIAGHTCFGPEGELAGVGGPQLDQ